MNERIKQLREQATTIEVISGRGFDTTQYIDQFDEEKFAELIIKECCQINYDFLESYKEACEVNDIIRKQFGVK